VSGERELAEVVGTDRPVLTPDTSRTAGQGDLRELNVTA